MTDNSKRYRLMFVVINIIIYKSIQNLPEQEVDTLNSPWLHLHLSYSQVEYGLLQVEIIDVWQEQSAPPYLSWHKQSPVIGSHPLLVFLSHWQVFEQSFEYFQFGHSDYKRNVKKKRGIHIQSLIFIYRKNVYCIKNLCYWWLRNSFYLKFESR